MKFSEKLNALMTLTGTTNTILARTLNFDRSVISRLKTGARSLPRPSTVQAMAEYFAGCEQSDYLQSALYELTHDPRLQLSLDQNHLASLLAEWLLQDDGFNRSHSRNLSAEIPQSRQAATGTSPGCDFTVFEGNLGKRQAVCAFWRILEAAPQPGCIHIFTDENNTWLMEDASFLAEVGSALSRLAALGWTFLLIRPVLDHPDEAFETLRRWLPCIANGAVKMYYYPWLRDRLHRRTLLVAPGIVSLDSNSLHNESTSLLTILTQNPSILNTSTETFNTLLTRCKPSIYSIHTNSPDRMLKEITASWSNVSSSIYKSSSLSVCTLPDELVNRVAQRGSKYAMQILQAHQKRIALRRYALPTHVIIDLMHLVPLERIHAGGVMIPGTWFNPEGPAFYTLPEYLLHLKTILRFLDEFPNYQVVFDPPELSSEIVVYACDEERALILKDTSPFLLYTVVDRAFASMLYQYLRSIADKALQHNARVTARELLLLEIQKAEKMLT